MSDSSKKTDPIRPSWYPCQKYVANGKEIVKIRGGEERKTIDDDTTLLFRGGLNSDEKQEIKWQWAVDYTDGTTEQIDVEFVLKAQQDWKWVRCSYRLPRGDLLEWLDPPENPEAGKI